MADSGLARTAAQLETTAKISSTVGGRGAVAQLEAAPESNSTVGGMQRDNNTIGGNNKGRAKSSSTVGGNGVTAAQLEATEQRRAAG